jgi:hypothetical protein
LPPQYSSPGRCGLRSTKEGTGANLDGIGEGGINLGPGVKSSRENAGHAAALGRDRPVRIQNPSNVFRERLNPRGIQGDSNRTTIIADRRAIVSFSSGVRRD